MLLQDKMTELQKLDAAVKAELKQCDEQLAAWRERRFAAEKNQLVLDGRIGQVAEFLQAEAPTKLTAAPDAVEETVSATN